MKQQYGPGKILKTSFRKTEVEFREDMLTITYCECDMLLEQKCKHHLSKPLFVTTIKLICMVNDETGESVKITHLPKNERQEIIKQIQDERNQLFGVPFCLECFELACVSGDHYNAKA